MRRYHPNKDRLIEDMKGVARFHRVGIVEDWRNMDAVTIDILWTNFGFRKKRIETFFGYHSSYYYQLDSGVIKFDDLKREIEEFLGREILDYINGKFDEQDVIKASKGSRYLQFIGKTNLSINNEIIKYKMMHIAITLKSLMDMGRNAASVDRFDQLMEQSLRTIYETTFMAEHLFNAVIQRLKDVGIEFEEIVDPIKEVNFD